MAPSAPTSSSPAAPTTYENGRGRGRGEQGTQISEMTKFERSFHIISRFGVQDIKCEVTCYRRDVASPEWTGEGPGALSSSRPARARANVLVRRVVLDALHDLGGRLGRSQEGAQGPARGLHPEGLQGRPVVRDDGAGGAFGVDG